MSNNKIATASTEVVGANFGIRLPSSLEILKQDCADF
jgi:hypothetical protein